MHEPLAVQEVDRLGDLQEDIQTLVVLPLLREAALSHPVLQVLLPTELHLDVQVHLEEGGGRSQRECKPLMCDTRGIFPEGGGGGKCEISRLELIIQIKYQYF